MSMQATPKEVHLLVKVAIHNVVCSVDKKIKHLQYPKLSDLIAFNFVYNIPIYKTIKYKLIKSDTIAKQQSSATK